MFTKNGNIWDSPIFGRVMIRQKFGAYDEELVFLRKVNLSPKLQKMSARLVMQILDGAEAKFEKMLCLWLIARNRIRYNTHAYEALSLTASNFSKLLDTLTFDVKDESLELSDENFHVIYDMERYTIHVVIKEAGFPVHMETMSAEEFFSDEFEAGYILDEYESFMYVQDEDDMTLRDRISSIVRSYADYMSPLPVYQHDKMSIEIQMQDKASVTFVHKYPRHTVPVNKLANFSVKMLFDEIFAEEFID